MNLINDASLEKELAKYLSYEEMDRLKRTKHFFELNLLPLEQIHVDTNIPIEYLSLLEEGTVIASKQVIELLESYTRKERTDC